MRKTLAVIAVVAALAAAPAASPAGDPTPGCATYAGWVPSGVGFWRGNGGWGQHVVTLVAETGGDPLAANRAAACP